MQKLFKIMAHIPFMAYYWSLDYLYLATRQISEIFRRSDPHLYIKPKQVSSLTPIILIPGIYERWNFMEPIARLLHNAGFPVHVVEGIGYNTGKVEDMAQKVCDYAAEHRLDSCMIVAHSKGGLVGKYLLSHYDENGIFKGLVAINTPFLGSMYALLSPFRSIRIFTPNSLLLAVLNADKDVNQKIVSVYGDFDPHIPGGCYLEGAKNIRLPVYGHFRSINNQKVHDTILSELRRLDK